MLLSLRTTSLTSWLASWANNQALLSPLAPGTSSAVMGGVTLALTQRPFSCDGTKEAAGGACPPPQANSSPAQATNRGDKPNGPQRVRREQAKGVFFCKVFMAFVFSMFSMFFKGADPIWVRISL